MPTPIQTAQSGSQVREDQAVEQSLCPGKRFSASCKQQEIFTKSLLRALVLASKPSGPLLPLLKGAAGKAAAIFSKAPRRASAKSQQETGNTGESNS